LQYWFPFECAATPIQQPRDMTTEWDAEVARVLHPDFPQYDTASADCGWRNANGENFPTSIPGIPRRRLVRVGFSSWRGIWAVGGVPIGIPPISARIRIDAADYTSPG
jgi:hypothetical protein